MMRQLRQATKPVMLFTAIAFVGLMVFTWGMDVTGRGGGGRDEVGRVNRDPVSYDAYMATYRDIYERVQSSQQEMISSQQNKDIEDQAFDQIVDQLLIRQELRSRGISVTDDEISEAAQFSPPDYMRPGFLDENGGLDLARYVIYLRTLPPDQLLILEAYYRDVIPRGKLLRQVGSGIYLSDAELWQQWKDQNELVEVRYVPLNPATRYEDSEFSVPPEEVAAYYRAHEEEFEVPGRATVKFVVLDKTPTPADTVASRERADSLRQQILDGADFAEIAELESSDQASAPLGGDLGVFPQGRMLPALDSVVFAQPIGEVTDPVQTSVGFHIIEVMERWASDSVLARHILIPIVRTDESEIELLTLADSVEDLGEAMRLDEAAAAVGLTTRTADITQTFPFIAGAGQISEGADWVFEEASPGDVSPVFETSTAFYTLELVSSEPAGVLPLEGATSRIEFTLLSARKMDRAGRDAQEVVDRVRAGGALVNVAAELNLEVRTGGPFSRDDFVPGMGRQNAAIGASFGLGVGRVSGVVSTPDNHYIVEVLARTAADSTEWRGQLSQQRLSAVALLQSQRLQEWIVALRAAARIVDRRDVVLAPQDEGATLPPLGF